MGVKYTSPSGLVTVYEPPPSSDYYILRWKEAGRPRTTHAGRSLEGALEKALERERKLGLADPSAASAKYFSQLLDAYVDPQRRKKNARSATEEWSSGYAEKVNRWVSKAKKSLGDARLEDLDQKSMYALINAESSYSQAVQFRSTLRALCRFGARTGYLRPSQSDIAEVEVEVPVGPRTRLKPTPAEGESVHLVDDSAVPSDDAVQKLATQDIGYAHWEGMVNTLAYAGPRIHECLALTAFDVELLFDDADTEFTALRIERQLVEPKGGGIRLAAPKNGKQRHAAVPDRTPRGFALAAWLQQRAVEAKAEQKAGTNPFGLLFPSMRGRYWRLRNFRKRCWDRACESAEWQATTLRAKATWSTRHGRVTRVVTHRLWAHPAHSLRHRFACTARDEWDWKERELCMAGGWASEQFVAQRYYALTSRVLVSAAQKQRGADSRPRLARASACAPAIDAEELA